ncbi:MAG: hypothetical protein ACOH1V_04930 [Stenotrophomonas sp.]
MALIKCGECGREVSNKAAACPGCGAPVDASLRNQSSVQPLTPPNLPLGPMPKIKGFWLYMALIGAIFVAVFARAIMSSPPDPIAAEEAKIAASERKAKEDTRHIESRAIEYCEKRYKEMNADRQYTPDMLRLHSTTCERMLENYKLKWGRNP